MRKTVSSKLFQEQIKDWLCPMTETSEKERYDLDSLWKLKNHVNDVEKVKKHQYR